MNKLAIVLFTVILNPPPVIPHPSTVILNEVKNLPDTQSAPGPLTILFWNLENYFDWIDSGNSDSDEEFSSYGQRHWTRKKFRAKSEAIAKALMWIGGKEGDMPDIVAVAEVENRFVLKFLTAETALQKYGYAIVHYESPDPRGIDVALLYRREKLSLIGSRPLRFGGDSLKTRDILLAEFSLRSSGEKVSILVNHHPSKYGGGDTGWKRNAAIKRLEASVDSLKGKGDKFIIATGDFNDTPENVRFSKGDESLINLASPLAAKGRGSIRYNGRWELIDMFMVSPELLPFSSMEIVEVPFLMTRDNVHSGEKPLRTYSGPRYLGGVSDHCPIILRISAIGGKHVDNFDSPY